MMDRRRKRIAIALVSTVLALLYTAASVLVTRWAETTRAACAQPCREFGFEIHTPPRNKDAGTIYKPACSPLRLDLELHRPVARRGSRYALWHRAKLMNVSCYALGGVDASDLLQSLESDGDTAFSAGNALQFKVWGPDGREVPSGGFARPQDYAFLYTGDFSELDRRGAGGRDYVIIKLAPGEAVATVPSILRAMKRDIAIDLRTGEHGLTFTNVATPPGAETPPPGFKIIDAFVFTRPGKYRIQAVFEDTISAKAIYPYRMGIPAVITLPVGLLYYAGVDLIPDSPTYYAHEYNVRAESRILEFSVPE